jgi:hypothetical protein
MSGTNITSGVKTNIVHTNLAVINIFHFQITGFHVNGLVGQAEKEQGPIITAVACSVSAQNTNGVL